MPKTYCENCNTLLMGQYCHLCGQRMITREDRTVKHFLYQFFGAAFFLENNFIKNLWLTFSKPGFIAKEIRAGRRKSYMNPFSVFLLINLVYFIVSPWNDLNLPLRDQLNQPWHKGIVQPLVQKRLSNREISMQDYESDYAQRSNSLSKSLIVLHAPIIALILALLYWKKDWYFVDHLIYAIYLLAFVLLLAIIVMSPLRVFLRLDLIHSAQFQIITNWTMNIGVPLYIFLSVKKYYQQNIWISLLKAPIVVCAFIISHFAYRTILFFIVFITT